MAGVVVLIPFRDQTGIDRRGQLNALVGRLRELVPDAAIVVAEQTADGEAFHRGALLNAGFEWASENMPGTRFVVTHDCDLLPDAEVAALYGVPRPFVCLAGVPGSRWAASPTFVGGVTGFTPDTFRRLNGFPVLDAWGWGGEDDEMRRRAGAVGVEVERNVDVGSYEDLEGTDIATKLNWLRLHRDQKNARKWELAAAHPETWPRNGLVGPLQPRVVEHRERGGVHRLLVAVPPPPTRAESPPQPCLRRGHRHTLVSDI